jgi:tRNA dimethylallyltransferase
MTEERRPVVVLVGPTAVGKSRVALELAGHIHGEIVTADSRQVYRYMDIGTAKPGFEERRLVRHHMIDLVEPSEAYSAQRFRDEAVRVLRGIQARGHVPIVAGGTGFYVRALMDGGGLASVAPNEELRAALRAQIDADGPASLHARLAAADPESAARIHPNNLPRVIRALEIIDAVGGPVPHAVGHGAVEGLYVGLTCDRLVLDETADARVLKQVEAGLVEETRDLLAMGYAQDSVALSGFGYREMVAYLAGRCDLDTAIAEYQRSTRRYIRRQYTWFKADRRIRWFDAHTQEVELLSFAGSYAQNMT